MGWFGEWFGSKGDEPVSLFGNALQNAAAQAGFGTALSDPGHSHQIGAGIGHVNMSQAQQNAINQQFAAMANQLGAHAHSVTPPPPRKLEPSWGVNITKVENGFMVVITDNMTGQSTRYIATDLAGVTDMITVGLVTARLES
jgi:hypothetical protein